LRHNRRDHPPAPLAACTESPHVSPSVPLPYARLAALYFGYFVYIGAFAPYFSLYLQSIGQSAFQIGLLLSLMQLMRIGAPHLWAALADRHGWRARLLQATLGGALVAYAGVFATTSFLGLFLVLAGFAFFTSATMPLLDAITLAGLRDRVERYGGIRLWGSIGFIVAVLGVGWMLDRIAIANLLWILAIPLAVTFVLTLTLRDAPAQGATAHESVWPLLVRRDVLVLLAANVLMNVAHGPLYAFFSIYLAQSGYGTTAIGALWSLGVLAEIGIFLAAPAWMKRFAAVDILIATFALGVVRFALIAWAVDSPTALVVAQVLHAATFGSCHVASVALVNQWFSGTRQVRGQAVYLSAAFGFGGFVGSLASGAAWEPLGPQWTYTAASGAVALGLILLLRHATLLRHAPRSTA
jgi:PPP family 3-phenylpropionic acid transporter